MNKEHISLYTSVTGNTIGYDVYRFGSGTKTLYIQGGVHGGEVTYFIFRELYTFLTENENRLTSEIALAPLINPRAWDQRMYHYTAGKFDWHTGKDWNRGFASDPDTTLSARMSSVVLRTALMYAECVDLHTARVSTPYTITTTPRAHEALVDIGLPYTIMARDPATYAGSCMTVCAEEGKTSYAIECGSHDSYSTDYVHLVAEGLINRIRYICMGVARHEKKEQFFTEKVRTLFAPVSGFTQYLHVPGAHVRKGDIVARIAHGSDLGTETAVTVPCDCTVLELSKTHVTTVGDELVRYIADEDLHPLDTLA